MQRLSQDADSVVRTPSFVLVVAASRGAPSWTPRTPPPTAHRTPFTPLHPSSLPRFHMCRNCGCTGHLYKDCQEPIMSFGLVCFRRMPTGVEYLMIQRKDSLAFMEFIRGKYDAMDHAYVSRLIENMTNYERDYLRTYTFPMLWNYVWYQTFLPKQTQEYYESKDKFEDLARTKVLDRLLHEAPVVYDEPEWGFPKGRRRLKEKDVDCAVREFCEETGLQKDDVRVYQDYPAFEEVFYGTNNVRYRHVYYIAELKRSHHKKMMPVDPDNIHQLREVRQIQWFDAEEVLDHIRDHNAERKTLFRTVHALMDSTVAKEERMADLDAARMATTVACRILDD